MIALLALAGSSTAAPVPPPPAPAPAPAVAAPDAARPPGSAGTEAGVAVSLAQALAAAESTPEVVLARAEELMAQRAVDVVARPSEVSVGLETHSVTARESVTLSYSPRWAGQRAAALSAARAEFAAASSSRELAIVEARHTVRAAWFTLAGAEQLARIQAEAAERAGRTSEAVSALFDQGRVAKLDVARAKAEASRAQSEAEGAEQTRASAADALGALLASAQPPGTGGDVPVPQDEETLESWVAAAGAASPEVRVQRLHVDAARARLDLARRQKIPALSVDVGADFNDPTQPGTDKRAGVTVSVPLNGGATVAVAEAALARESAELNRLERVVRTRTQSAWRTARASREKLASLDASAVPAAREAAELTRIAYQEGKVDLFRLLDAERALSETEIERWQAYQAWGLAWADLLWSAGKDV